MLRQIGAGAGCAGRWSRRSCAAGRAAFVRCAQFAGRAGRNQCSVARVSVLGFLSLGAERREGGSVLRRARAPAWDWERVSRVGGGGEHSFFATLKTANLRDIQTNHRLREGEIFAGRNSLPCNTFPVYFTESRAIAPRHSGKSTLGPSLDGRVTRIRLGRWEAQGSWR